MAIKSFNIDEKVYQKFAKMCKEHGISMSKQVERFMASQIEKGLQANETHTEKGAGQKPPRQPAHHDHAYR
ncbi:MAG: hypothetical protein N3G22_04395 [Candidatus Micrarchaeota archaeon]|nr:hypothetical protein [Candidatus Micrarchaeota archaeon]